VGGEAGLSGGGASRGDSRGEVRICCRCGTARSAPSGNRAGAGAEACFASQDDGIDCIGGEGEAGEEGGTGEAGEARHAVSAGSASSPA
jgi:hypothetical protein